MRKKLLVIVLICCAEMLCFPFVLPAQTIVTGGFSGTITDPTGSTVPGATLTLTSNTTGDTYSTISSSIGAYVFSLLKPGDYTLTAKRDGFKTATQKITVLLGQNSTVNFAMEVGAVTTTVEVTGEGNLLQTQDANIATTFDTRTVQNIPNPGNDITYIAQTAPGVSMNTSSGPGFGNFSAFGLPGTSNLFTVNGNDYNDPFLNLNNSGASNLLLGSNEVQEVAVVVNGYTGQYGRQAGAQIDYNTKSGTNAFHGDAIYNWTGRALSANDFFNNAGGVPRPFENNNAWAAAFGGPIKKDKAFFFVDTEGTRYIFGTSQTVNVPTPALEAFTLANVPASAQAFYTNAFNLYNSAPGISRAVPVTQNSGVPATDPTFANSCGSLGQVPTAASPNPLFNPEFTTTPCLESFRSSVSNGNPEWLLTARLDYNFNDNNKVFGRVKFDRGTQPTYTDPIN